MNFNHFNPKDFTISKNYPITINNFLHQPPSSSEMLELVKLIFTNTSKSNYECLEILNKNCRSI